MTEMARHALSHAMDVQAGHAIQVGPRNRLAHAYIGIPICITVEGANILTRNLIIFGQGAIRCHPYILSEIELFATQDTPQKIDKLDQLLLSHMGYAVSNFARNIVLGLTAGKIIFSPVRGVAAPYYRKLTRMSAALALLADLTMLTLGGQLKRKERISARLGDILSQLYLASSVLKYFHDHEQTASDVDYMKWCVEKCLYHIQHAIDELLNNFPLQKIGKLLHWLIFPYGTAYRKPRDSLYHKIVGAMLQPSRFRERLTNYFYLSKSPKDPATQMETALAMSVEVEGSFKKFQNALRDGRVPQQGTLSDRLQAAYQSAVLSTDEFQALQTFHSLMKEVITVDEFSFDLKNVLN
jgi:hypothetical protein